MEDIKNSPGYGWLPDYPDFRDYTYNHSTISPKMKQLNQSTSINAMLKKVGVTSPTTKSLPTSTDLTEWASPIENQESLGSCTAQAGAGLVEYFENRAFNKHTNASRLFLYKVTRNLLHWTGDTGAYLRSTMGAMVLFGVPPEEYWPYDIGNFDLEPSNFLYSFARNYQTISYYRLDPSGIRRDTLLKRIKLHLKAGLPSMFGFTVYSSINQASTTGKIPFPTANESRNGGHAVMAIGYDDNIKIKNNSRDGIETKGALLIRNSWGTSWGDDGYGWLPYKYIIEWLAIDWWSIIKNEWIDTGVFKI